MKVTGHTFVVTGGGSGIGRELTLLLLKKGARVAAVDLNEAGLKETRELADKWKDRISLHVLNITDQIAVKKLPAAVAKIHGSVDAVINNAGIIQRFVRVNDLEVPEMEKVFNVNFWGMVFMTKAFLPILLERPEAHIINTSSMGGYLPVPGQTVYGASKAAVKLFTEGLRSELLNTPVHVSVVFPGSTATNIASNSGVTASAKLDPKNLPKIKLNTAPAAAATIVAGIEKDQYHIIVGQDAKSMDLLTRLMPERAAKIIYNNMRSLLS